MKVLSIANHKGGVGKTATARALGDYLAGAGYKTLLIDMDPQASLTMSCGFRLAVTPGMVDVMGGAAPGTLSIPRITKRVSDNLDLAPSNLDLSGVELGIVSRLGREYILKKALSGLTYDIAIIDNPPALSLLVVNALVASHGVLIPTQLMPVDVMGVKAFIHTLTMIKEGLGCKAEIVGILPTFYDTRLNTHQEGLEAMEAAGWPVLPVNIGRSVRVGEAAGQGQSVITYEPTNPQAGNYIELGRIIELWLKK